MKQTTTPTSRSRHIPVLYWLILVLLPLLSKADERYSVELPECPALLERRALEPERLILRSDCALSLKSLAKVLEDGLQGLFPDNRINVRSIQIGRLMEYPEWSQTLAGTASRSSAWDSRRGKPRNGNESSNLVVTRLLNGPAYPNPLKAIFSRYDLTACIAEVEKVLVFEARDMIPASTLQHSTISKKARLPFDAQIWLTLHAGITNCAMP